MVVSKTFAYGRNRNVRETVIVKAATEEEAYEIACEGGGEIKQQEFHSTRGVTRLPLLLGWSGRGD